MRLRARASREVVGDRGGGIKAAAVTRVLIRASMCDTQSHWAEEARTSSRGSAQGGRPECWSSLV